MTMHDDDDEIGVFDDAQAAAFPHITAMLASAFEELATHNRVRKGCAHVVGAGTVWLCFFHSDEGVRCQSCFAEHLSDDGPLSCPQCTNRDVSAWSLNVVVTAGSVLPELPYQLRLLGRACSLHGGGRHWTVLSDELPPPGTTMRV